MSKPLIHQYYQNLDRTLQFGKSGNEQSIRNHLWALLNEYARKHNYEVVPEAVVMGMFGKKVRPDGTVKKPVGTSTSATRKAKNLGNIRSRPSHGRRKLLPLY